MRFKVLLIHLSVLISLVGCNRITASYNELIKPSAAETSPSISFSGASGTSGGVGALLNIAPTSFSNNGFPITNCSIAPVLPSGLSIDPQTCVISGTPTSMFPLTEFLVTVTNSQGETSAAVSLEVTPSVPSLSYSNVIGNVGVEMTIIPVLNSNGATITSCMASPALPAELTLNNTTCSINGTPLARLASTLYTVTVSNSRGSTSSSFNLEVGCPLGYLPIAANSDLSSESFCIMRYEAKCSSSLDGPSICSPSEGAPSSSKIAISVAAGIPWMRISAPQALTACQNLNALYGVSGKFDLLSNQERMAVARSIEAESSNWTTDGGVRKINRGHSDRSPNAPCDGSFSNVDTNCSTVGTNPYQKRTHTISGDVIWDFAGNVWEWTDWTIETPANSFSLASSTCPLALREIQDKMIECAGDFGDPALASPFDPLLTSTNNIGLIWGAQDGSRGGLHMGGSFREDEVEAGVYSFSLNTSSATNYSTNLGFRCVFRK